MVCIRQTDLTTGRRRRRRRSNAGKRISYPKVIFINSVRSILLQHAYLYGAQ